MPPEQDLAEMYEYGFWEFGELQADKFYSKLFDRLELITNSPFLGKAADDIYPELRRFELTPYVVFYQVKDYGVYVLRFLKQSQIVKPEYLAAAVKSESSKNTDH
ncbi:MAG: type II toxin-antitoxin system RelE/ParE family toxin [Pseudomonadales bacterium]|nr:type II toxin-antitoxin system RelE/ParE family toxin [Pseudomonadales bacterium]